MADYLAGVAEWRDADTDPPPRGRKILVLSRMGVALLSEWYAGAVAWAPLPKVPADLKTKLLARQGYGPV